MYSDRAFRNSARWDIAYSGLAQVSPLVLLYVAVTGLSQKLLEIHVRIEAIGIRLHGFAELLANAHGRFLYGGFGAAFDLGHGFLAE